MATEVSIRKEPEQMSAEEIIYELKGLTIAGTRSHSLITQLEKLYNHKCRVVESMEAELGIVNDELTLLRQTQTEPQLSLFEVHEGHMDSTTTILSDVQIKAYCEGIADAANQIRYFVESCTEDEDDDL